MKRDKRGNRVIRGLQLWLMILLKIFHLILIESARRDRIPPHRSSIMSSIQLGCFGTFGVLRHFWLKNHT